MLANPKIKLYKKSFSRRLTLTNGLKVKFWMTHKTKRHTQSHHSLITIL